MRTGFQAKYLDPFYRKLLIDRGLLEEEDLKNLYENRSPPDNGPPDTQKLEDLVEVSKQPLLKIKQAIPLNPFPNEVIIDINKVNIIIRYFFMSAHIHSVYIKDVSDVIVETGVFFSTLKLVDVGFTENSIDVNYLRTRDAIKARRIIQGLVVAQKNNIDLSKCEFSDLVPQLEELGKVEEHT